MESAKSLNDTGLALRHNFDAGADYNNYKKENNSYKYPCSHSGISLLD